MEVLEEVWLRCLIECMAALNGLVSEVKEAPRCETDWWGEYYRSLMIDYTLKWEDSIEVEIVAAGNVFEMSASAVLCGLWMSVSV